jgi:hypothetical protein
VINRITLLLFIGLAWGQTIPDKKLLSKIIFYESQFRYKELEQYFHPLSEDYQQHLLLEELNNILKQNDMNSNDDFSHKIESLNIVSKEKDFLILRADIDYGLIKDVLDVQQNIKGRIEQFWIFKLEGNNWKLWSRVNLDNPKL